MKKFVATFAVCLVMPAWGESIQPSYINEINEHVIFPCIRSALAAQGKEASFGNMLYFSNLPSADGVRDTAIHALVMIQPGDMNERLDVYEAVRETCNRAIGTEA